MKLLHLIAALVTMALAGHATGQTCPKVKATTVPEDVKFKGFQDCGGVKFEVPGISFNTANRGCPLMAIYKPDHEQQEASDLETETRVWAQTTTRLIFFRCDSSYFLLVIPDGKTCVHDRTVAGGPLPRMLTVGCKQTPVAQTGS